MKSTSKEINIVYPMGDQMIRQSGVDVRSIVSDSMMTSIRNRDQIIAMLIEEIRDELREI